MTTHGVSERARSLLLETVIVKAHEASMKELTMMLWPFNREYQYALYEIAYKQAQEEARNGHKHSRAFEVVE